MQTRMRLPPRRTRFLLAGTALLIALWSAPAVRAQTGAYTLALRGVALQEALETFVHTTGVSLAYDPELVRGRRSFCAIKDASAEAVLRCLLSESGLDFYRLSSGTYVLTERTELPPREGYLAGVVVDRETGAPLPYAHVILQNAGMGSVTNQAGQFVFPPLLPGRYAMAVSYLGYRTWQDTLEVAPSVRVRAEARLQPEPILFTPVVVDGLQQRLPSESLAWSATEPSDGEMHFSGRPLNALSALPGLRVNDATAGVHLQGGDSGEHQFRLDGVPVFLPRHVVGFVGPFNTLALDRITVHKAGFGAALGSHLSGVVAAEHALDGPNGLDAQVDLLSANARLRQSIGPREAPRATFMASGRLSLWDYFRPPALEQTLNAWTVPDLFLLLSPMRASNAPAFQVWDDWLPGFVARMEPSLQFSDLHLAGRIRLAPLRTLHASFYRGRSLLDGTPRKDAPPIATTERLTPTFTLADSYDWQNTLGQVRYDAVLGAHTLASVQVRGSQYELIHDYERLDSLRLDPSPMLTAPLVSILQTTHARDGNAVQVLSAEGTLDHARGRHHLRLGGEVSRVNSRFNLLSVNLPSAGRERPTDGITPEISYWSGADTPLTSDAARWWIAAYAEDGLTLSQGVTADAGVRLTFQPERATVYAEPRAALRVDRTRGPLGPWSARTAVGLYRQFIYEFDVSKLNAGALLPAVRVWLPLDNSVRPPLSIHVAQSFLVTPRPGFELRAEAYAKFQPHGLALHYLPADTTGASGRVVDMAQILADTQGRAAGASVSAAWTGRTLTLRTSYALSRAVQRSDALFDGREQDVPWNEPHHVNLSAAWHPTSRVTLSARWQGVWGRTWGFRRAYYDYFGHSEQTRRQGPFDLGNPSEHVLPPLYQLDLGLAYTHTAGPAALQIRVDVLNALDRENVADWWLVVEDAGTRKVPRPLYPRIPSVAVRVTF